MTDIAGVLLSNKGKTVEKKLEYASALLARDYKGFGNQAQTGGLEWKK